MVDKKPTTTTEESTPPRKKRAFYSPDLGKSVFAHDNQEAKEIVNKKLSK
jgi:hypothetical protein